MAIERAIRTRRPVHALLFGPSGSGKTKTALEIATRLAGEKGKILVLDTEAASSATYADEYSFDIEAEFPDQHPHRYVRYLEVAANEGYNVVIIDSISHEWNGTSGILELVSAVTNRKGEPDSMQGWNRNTPLHNGFLRSITQVPFHLIATCRAKEDAVQYDNEGGKKTVTRIEYKLEQRDNVFFEFDVALRLFQDHTIRVEKTRYPEIPDGHVYGADEGPTLGATIAEAGNQGGDPEQWEEAALARYMRGLFKACRHDDIRHAIAVGSLNGKTMIPVDLIDDEKFRNFLKDYITRGEA